MGNRHTQVFQSTLNIGTRVTFLDDNNIQQTGTISATTLAEVGPNAVGVWYKIFQSDQTEIEIEDVEDSLIRAI